jgi:hypothetical protein
MCPSCHSNDVSRSRKRKLKDSFMRWMGKVAYRCRDCQKRFYVAIDIDRRLRSAEEWRRRSQEHASGADAGNSEGDGEDTPERADTLGL